MKKLTKNVYLEELIHPDIFRQFGNSSIWFLDQRLPDIIQALCDDLSVKYDREVKVRLNTWPWGGRFKDKGLRKFDSKTGSKMSDHKFGRAADPEFIFADDGKEIPPDDVRDFILANEKKYMAMGLTTLEHKKFAPGWVHLSTRWTGLTYILIVKPKS